MLAESRMGESRGTVCGLGQGCLPAGRPHASPVVRWMWSRTGRLSIEIGKHPLPPR